MLRAEIFTLIHCKLNKISMKIRIFSFWSDQSFIFSSILSLKKEAFAFSFLSSFFLRIYGYLFPLSSAKNLLSGFLFSICLHLLSFEISRIIYHHVACVNFWIFWRVKCAWNIWVSYSLSGPMSKMFNEAFTPASCLNNSARSVFKLISSFDQLNIFESSSFVWLSVERWRKFPLSFGIFPLFLLIHLKKTKKEKERSDAILQLESSV